MGAGTETADDARIEAFLSGAYRFVEEHSHEWDLRAFDGDLETFNHLLRVWIQDASLETRLDHVYALCRAQHADGGWGHTRDDATSRVRQSGFGTHMLLRLRKHHDDDVVRASGERGLRFVLDHQLPDGSWKDDRWNPLDATSMCTGALMFTVDVDALDRERRAALDRAMEFILARRHDDGMWYVKPGGSPVEITAHFLQKCTPYGIDSEEVTGTAMRGLLERQAPEGHWDQESVDATCDAARSLMLCATTRVGAGLRADVEAAALRAVAWLCDAQTQRGLGPRPGRTPNVLMTCDGIDTMLKFRRFVAAPVELVTFYR